MKFICDIGIKKVCTALRESFFNIIAYKVTLHERVKFIVWSWHMLETTFLNSFGTDNDSHCNLCCQMVHIPGTRHIYRQICRNKSQIHTAWVLVFRQHTSNICPCLDEGWIRLICNLVLLVDHTVKLRYPEQPLQRSWVHHLEVWVSLNCLGTTKLLIENLMMLEATMSFELKIL